MINYKFIKFGILSIFLFAQFSNITADELSKNFVVPPKSARPWVYWFPLNGNLTRDGITLDFEAMERVGIGGLIYMEVDQGTPKGEANFLGKQWLDLFEHACEEASRLSLEINVNNDAGWCGSGGPWITPELSMKKVVWSELSIMGGQQLDLLNIPQPKAERGFYRDIAILAMPMPSEDERIPQIQGKASFRTQRFLPLQATFAESDASSVIRKKDIQDLTGKATWAAPPGKWLVLRFGYTTTGKDNHPAPESGRGLECDKFDKDAVAAHFNACIGKLAAENKRFLGKGKVLVSTHIDSWEVGSQNWTEKMPEEFNKRRGYDILPFLPVFTGRIVESIEITERFLWDLRKTVSDLIIENYAGEFRRLANKNGIRLSIEAYDDVPADEMAYAGQADEPMGEFWSWDKYFASYSCTEMTSAGHVYGKRIIGAEAFTANNAERWLGHPGNIKDLADWAFCEGINRFVIHRYAAQPWVDVCPGISMGPWGLHYERTQTWWDYSRPWHEYLARCQYMLQQGLFVADILFLQPEGAPRRFTPPPGVWAAPYIRCGYNFDGCPSEVILKRVSVKNNRLIMPDGMSYRVLVLPAVETMTPELLGKIKELITAGATVFAPMRPSKSPSLSGYPMCDAYVQRLADELWGHIKMSNEIQERRIGKGRLICGGYSPEKQIMLLSNAIISLTPAKWIWRNEGVPITETPPGVRYFKRIFVLDSVSNVLSGRLVITADNSFECIINDKKIGIGDDFHKAYVFDITPVLRNGTNIISVVVTNFTDKPNPAGLIGLLVIKLNDGRLIKLPTDDSWEVSDSVNGNWARAIVIGTYGIEPWGEIDSRTQDDQGVYADVKIVHQWLKDHGVPPDFVSDPILRYIHRATPNDDIYFVANPQTNEVKAVVTFRVSDKKPQLWWPDKGIFEEVKNYEVQNGCTKLNLRLDPAGSVFVVFRKGRFSNMPKQNCSSRNIHQDEAVLIKELSGPWEVTFDKKWGGPGTLIFDKLDDWSKRPEDGIRYYSGTAIFRIRFEMPDHMPKDSVYFLDLGTVEVVAEVILNDRSLGVLWKKPFVIELTDKLKSGVNNLEIKVANLWINRMIRDEFLAEDSERNTDGTLKSWPLWLVEGKPSPAGRYTFTSWRLWKKTDTLVPSGLIGPIKLYKRQN